MMGSVRHSLFMVANFVLISFAPSLGVTDPGHELVMLWYWKQI